MMRKIAVLISLFLCLAVNAYAAISITTDHRMVAFGALQPDEEKELAEFGTYHNQITCSSTNKNTWYLKISVLHPLSFGAENIPLENFMWQMSYTNGIGTAAYWHQYKSFSNFGDLVYTSGPDEATGKTITLQFKYYLKVPEEQLSGPYSTTIRFTLTEIL